MVAIAVRVRILRCRRNAETITGMTTKRNGARTPRQTAMIVVAERDAAGLSGTKEVGHFNQIFFSYVDVNMS